MRLKSVGYSDYLAAKVSPVVARFSSASSHPIPHFDIFVAPVDWDYPIPEEVTAIVPLWSSNTDAYCRWHRQSRDEYVCVAHDSSDWWLIAHFEQGLLADLYRRYFESLPWDDESEDQRKCDTFAAYIGFTRQQKADSLLARSHDDFQQWIKQGAW